VADGGLVLTRLLAAARGGDEQAFVALTSPHRRALHVHAYRMLGNLHDADDALQETLLRAWRGLGGFEPHAPLGAWLHRIATNVALRMLERRKPVEPLDRYLQPYPDRFIDELPTPEEQTLARERLGLAYIATMQVLPVRQRAVLALRDGLGWSARETGRRRRVPRRLG
jgi:RNA polymerase sigma factor (sigma-70 family)